MSMFIYPSFNPQGQIEDDGEAMVYYDDFQILESLTKSAKITSLMTFADNREIPEDFDGDPDELEEMMGPWDEWFDAEQGKRTVTDLLAFIDREEDARDSFAPDSAVFEQLNAILKLLEQAASKNVKFRWELSH